MYNLFLTTLVFVRVSFFIETLAATFRKEGSIVLDSLRYQIYFFYPTAIWTTVCMYYELIINETCDFELNLFATTET